MALAASCVPLPTQVATDGVVTIVDGQRHPLAHVLVRQQWVDFRVGEREAVGVSLTDEAGVARFPARWMRRLALWRFWRGITGVLDAHRSSSVAVSYAITGYRLAGDWYRSSPRSPVPASAQLVATSSSGGGAPNPFAAEER